MKPAVQAITLLLLLIVLYPRGAQGQITQDFVANAASTASGGNAGPNTTLTWSHTIGSGANGVLLVGISFRTDNEGGCTGTCPGPTTIVTGVKLGSTSFTGCIAAIDDNATGSCGTAASGTTYLRSEIWYLLNPPSGTNSIVVTVANSTMIAGISASYFGVASAASGGATASNNAATGSTSASVGPITSSALVMDNLAVPRSIASATPTGSNQSSLAGPIGDSSSSGPHISGFSSKDTATNPTMSWTLNPTEPWAMVAAVLTPKSQAKRRGQVIVGTLRPWVAPERDDIVLSSRLIGDDTQSRDESPVSH